MAFEVNAPTTPLVPAVPSFMSSGSSIPAPSGIAEAVLRTHRRLRARLLAPGFPDVIWRAPETVVPHPLLRRLLQSDPAMAPLLPVAPAPISLGVCPNGPFFLTAGGVLLIAPALLRHQTPLSVAVRWGFELAMHARRSPLRRRQLDATLRHASQLLERLPTDARLQLLDTVPEVLRDELDSLSDRSPSDALLRWQSSLFERCAVETAGSEPAMALTAPVETLLVVGGDSRLRVDPATGMNKYGATPRPRPEAIQFSSSTASSVSEHGFVICELLRRDLLHAESAGVASTDLRDRLTEAIAEEIFELLGVDSNHDICLAPSGTDTELIAVAVALAGSAHQPLRNIVIAPEETGRGVALASAGRYFDAVAATGAAVELGAAAWPGRHVEVINIAIRQSTGVARTAADVDEDLQSSVAEAVSSGQRVLIHALCGSKTGLSAPSVAALDAIAREHPGSVDIVVDACQMRTPFADLAGFVDRGWMVQISGSKFFTGPPFSGALLVPGSFRPRRGAIASLLHDAPGVGSVDDWCERWRRPVQAPRGGSCGFGPLFRWAPALLEARLWQELPSTERAELFLRFREALDRRLASSQYLQVLDMDRLSAAHMGLDLAGHSIACFHVEVPDRNGARRLTHAECQRLFELMNRDVTARLSDLPPRDHAVAAQPAHLGQPVQLAADGGGDLTVLRLVIGARYFSIVGHVHPFAREAALQSQIADAVRAIDKIELIARHWADLA